MEYPVLVTGVDGYVAGVLVRELLNAGYTVHGTVIQPLDQLQYLQDLADQSTGTLRLFHANLMTHGAFVEPMKNCQVVFHTASPFRLTNQNVNPQENLMNPAIYGTENVLQTAIQTPSVRRVVLTSSVGAVYGDASDTYDAPNHILNEQIWNTTSTLAHQPYFFSKTCAEQTAWEIAKQPHVQWTMVSLNPALILGPGIRYHAESESFQTIRKMTTLHYTMLTGVPAFAMPMVDVRDVAWAHLRAGNISQTRKKKEKMKNAAADADTDIPSGRYILCSANTSFPQMTTWLRQMYPQYSIPAFTTPIPRAVLAFIAPFLGMGIDAQTVWKNMHWTIHLDNSKSRSVLGLQYRDPATTLHEMLEQMIEAGVVRPGPRPELVGLSIVVVILAMAVSIGYNVIV